MPRKIRTESRSKQIMPSASASTVKRPSTPRATRDVYYQCMHCGGLVDPAFFTTLESWCPHCEDEDCIVWQEGAIPAPTLYGSWLHKQKRNPIPTSDPPKIPQPLKPIEGAPVMKRVKYHSGTYCCPKCYAEFDLAMETNLKCETCGGPLVKGSLDQYTVVENDSEEDDN